MPATRRRNVPAPAFAPYAEVESILRRTVDTVEEVFGAEHPHMATALENLAAALRRIGRDQEAALTDAKAVAIRNDSLIRSGRGKRTRPSAASGPAREMPPAVLDIAGAARYLAISAYTVYGLVRSGDLPHARVGKSIRFRPGDLDRFLDERTSRQWLRLDSRGRPRR